MNGIMIRPLKHLLLAALGALLPWIASADQALRVATWNIQTVGVPGSLEFNAAAAVLARLDADVVALQEVASDSDVGALTSLASTAGYSYSMAAAAGPYGTLRGAIMSRHPFQLRQWASPELALDAQADDLTRYLLQADISVAGSAETFRLITTHWKSGGANSDEFRRAIESFRISQVAGSTPATMPMMLMGDVNADIGDGALSPATFTTLPTGLPTTFVVGADIRAVMNSQGLANNPFAFLGQHATMINALQPDGNDATRPFSGRRIDYLYANAPLVARGIAAQVYDCADDGLSNNLELAGTTPLDAQTCTDASDHLPLIADVVLASAGVPAYSVTPQNLSFGNGTLGLQSPLQTLTVSSTGTAPLALSGLALTGATPSQFSVVNNCVGDLPPGNTCTLAVSFTPTTTGTKTATLAVSSNAGAQTVPLTGVGVTSAFTLSVSKLSFGRVARNTTSNAQTVRLTNTGKGALPITGISLGGTHPGQFAQTSNCGAQVAPGANCVISVTFRPTSTGSKSASLRVTASGGAAARSVALSGTGF